MIPYTPPSQKESAFNCPHCGAYSKQDWNAGTRGGGNIVPGLYVAQCHHCHKFSYWHEREIVYPRVTTAPLPNADLPEDIRRDYEEARSIASLSPRGAAALLRLAIQKLAMHLGEKGEDLNSDIANLVRKGLSEKIQKALDSVRVVGNEAVHPGLMDLRDDSGTVGSLFDLVNLIVEATISQPKKIDQIYEKLPDSKKEQIRKRDSKG